MEVASVNVALALAAGVLSFISPCVLPLVPAYLGYIAGASASDLASGGREVRRRAVLNAVAFIVGLAIIFTLLGATASSVGQLLQGYRPITTKIAGLLIIVFGLQMSGLLSLPVLATERRVDFVRLRQRGGYLGAFLMGSAFAVGWTPCVGYILGSILLLASQTATVTSGMVMLFVYSLGLGLPFLLTALAVQRSLLLLGGVRRHLHHLTVTGGVVLVAMGVLVFSDKMALISNWFTQVFGYGLTI